MINIHYYSGKSPEKKNFGDEIAPYIISKLLKTEKFMKNEPFENYIFNIMCIGSILHNTNNDYYIYGTGIRTEEQPIPSHVNNLNILSVRGPLTQKHIRSKGLACPDRYGDPALLLPLYYKPNIYKQASGKIGIIPHMSNYYKYINKKLPPDFFLINPYNDWKTVVNQIFSCKIIISSGLHGLICADAYNIPNVWLKESIPEGFFKFNDYILSQEKYQQTINTVEEFNLKQYLHYKNTLINPEDIRDYFYTSDFYKEYKHEFKQPKTIYNISSIIQPCPAEQHYYGWSYIINNLKQQINPNPNGLKLHTWADSFFWDSLSNQLPTTPWLGIIHSSINNDNNNFTVDRFLKSSQFLAAKDKCKGLISTTRHVALYLKNHIDIPIYHLTHPKKDISTKFNLKQYLKSPKIIHNGATLRNFNEFFNFDTKLKKVIYTVRDNPMLVQATNSNIDNFDTMYYMENNPDIVAGGFNTPEKAWNHYNLHGHKENRPTRFYKNLNNIEIYTGLVTEEKYIKRLTESIGFAFYYDCAASNLILEHIKSYTPLIVNKIPPIVEYLGFDYPLYLQDIINKPDRYLYDPEFLQECSDYLKKISKHKKFSQQNFNKFFTK